MAPAGFPASLRRGARIAAAIAALVVLPFVAEMITEPCARRAARRDEALESSALSTRPGKVVPPPLPVSREAKPTPRAARVLITSGILTVRTSLQDASPCEA